MGVIERFLDYVQIDTRSNELPPGTETHPSSVGQKEFADRLVDDLRAMGIGETPATDLVRLADESFFVHLRPTSPAFENAPHVVFAAHLDTYYEVPGKANPQERVVSIGDLVINEALGVIIPAADLEGLEGKRIITTDGTTLLGADDKAGVAAMMEVIELILRGKTHHGPLSFWFCVDEEVGQMDITVLPEKFVRSWDVLYTLDGERLGTVDIGCFVCRKIVVTFTGVSAHPGVSGDKLKPAHYAAALFMEGLSELPTPMETSDHESFHYAVNVEGSAAKAVVTCVPRSFDFFESEDMMRLIRRRAEAAAAHYDVGLDFDDRLICRNTRPAIEEKMELVQPAIDTLRSITCRVPVIGDVRGGTDGAMVNMHYPALPAPNLGVGGTNLHGPQEFLVVDELEILVDVVLEMIVRFGGMTAKR